LLFGAATFLGTKWFLGSDLGPGLQAPELEFSTAVHEQRWPFRLTEVTEGILVSSVADGVADVKVGDILLTVDGRSIEDWIADAEHQVYASSDLARRRLAIAHLAQWDAAADRQFKFLQADGSEHELRFPHPYRFDKAAEVELYSPERHHTMLEDGIAYFRPGHFNPPPNSGWPGPAEGRDAILADSYAQIDGIIGELKDARALVLDLRGNPGGTDLLGQFLVDRLVEEDYTYFQLSSLRNNGWGSFSKHRSSSPEGEHSMAGKPLAVIVDSMTFSTADNVAGCLRDVHPNVRLIGRMNEGVPVKIDVPVQWTRADVLNGRDPDLAAAVASLNR